MGTINSNGIFVYDDTESLSPLSSYMNLQGSALSTRLSQDVRFKKVANEAARTAYVNEVGVANISASNTLAVHRSNAPEGLRFEVTYNGTTWRVIADKDYYDAQDTGWVTVPLASGFTGTLFVRKQSLGTGSQVTLRGAITGSWVAVATTPVATVPEGFRPAAVHPNPSVFSNGEFNWGNVTSSGVVSTRKTVTGTSTLFVGTSWLI